MRKIILIFLIISSVTGYSLGQGLVQMALNQPAALVADAGRDTTCCKGHPVILGGEPTAKGGNKSYIYLWTPSTGLDNPTSAHPVATLDESMTYMLSVTDANGCQAVSTVRVEINLCLGVNENPLNPSLTLFPNPSSGKFRIQGISSFSGTLQKIEIINQLGEVVFSQQYEPQFANTDLEIDTRIEAAGIYYLKVSLSDQLISKRLIIR